MRVDDWKKKTKWPGSQRTVPKTTMTKTRAKTTMKKVILWEISKVKGAEILRCEMSTYVVPFLFRVAPQHITNCLSNKCGNARWNFQTNFERFSPYFKRSYKLPFWYQSFERVQNSLQSGLCNFQTVRFKKLSNHHPTSHGKIAWKWKLRRFF